MNSGTMTTWWTHFRTHRLLKRYVLGPSLGHNSSVRVATHLTHCDACRTRYDALTARLQQVSGMAAHRSTQWQRDALFERVMGELPAISDASSVGAGAQVNSVVPMFPAWRLGIAAAAMVALVVTVWARWPYPQSQFAVDSDEYAAVRGGVDDLPAAAFGVSGVDPQGGEYEVVFSEGVCPQDALRFYARVRDPEFSHVLLFAIQEQNVEPLWYFPDSTTVRTFEVPESAEPWLFPDEIPLAPNHAAGALLVVGVFARNEVSVDQLEQTWSQIRKSAPEADGITLALQVMEAWTGEDYVIQGTPIRILDSCPGGRP